MSYNEDRGGEKERKKERGWVVGEVESKKGE